MSKEKRRVAILGSTGSIGTQALEVIAENPELFEVEVLTCRNSADLLIQQALKFNPNTVVIVNEMHYDKVFDALDSKGIKVFCGEKSQADVVTMDSIDVVLTALVGQSGLLPTVKAIEAGKVIALANKETLVVAGALINDLALRNKVPILPVDSEHSAIFQCLQGENTDAVEKIILTASGGPFRGKDAEFLKSVKKEQALKHPNWDMGAKITIDSATLMNKGLEVIEARWLFGTKPKDIQVVVHPQSIIHSMVQFVDGSIKAQMGLPDMKHPIAYALAYPHRLENSYERFSFWDHPTLTFEKPDIETFPNLGLAFEAMFKAGNMPCVLNAANEVAVDLFLKDRINFIDIPKIIENSLSEIDFIKEPTLDDYLQTDRETRIKAAELAP